MKGSEMLVVIGASLAAETGMYSRAEFATNRRVHRRRGDVCTFANRILTCPAKA